MTIALRVIGLTLLGAASASAQTNSRPASAEAPSMTSSPTTLAPVAAGSTKMHEVPTPSVEKRTTSIGTGAKLTGKGGN